MKNYDGKILGRGSEGFVVALSLSMTSEMSTISDRAMKYHEGRDGVGEISKKERRERESILREVMKRQERGELSCLVKVYDFWKGGNQYLYKIEMEKLDRLGEHEEDLLIRDIERFEDGKLDDKKMKRLGGKFGKVRRKFWLGIWEMMSEGLGYNDWIAENVMKDKEGNWKLVDLETSLYRIDIG